MQRKGAMACSSRVRLLVAAITCSPLWCIAQAQTSNADNAPAPNAPPASFFERPRVFDWPRSPTVILRNHGVNLDISYTEYGQAVVAGDGDHGWPFSGKFFPRLTLDGQRLAGWKGFSVSAVGEISAGNSQNTNSGAGLLFPVNTALFGPADGKYGGDLSLTVTQRFGERFTVTIGKFNMFEAASRAPIVGGGGIDGFWNLSLAAPFTGLVPPYIGGGSFSYRTRPAQITVMIYDPKTAQQQTGFKNWGEDGITVRSAVLFPMNPGGRAGFNTLTFIASSKTGTDYNDLPQLLLPEHPSLGTRTGSYYGGYNIQQFLWQNPANPSVGWGVFGLIGFGDANPNPLSWTMNAGVSGIGVVPRRPLDRFGAGYFYVAPSRQLINALRTFQLNYGRETGGEVYYTLAAAGWFRVTADLQVVAPANHNASTVVLPGISAQIRF
jgi:porin